MGDYVSVDRVFILAFDGLEYDLVVKFRFRSLLQAEYGKVDISDFGVKATPLLWYSFITGLSPGEGPLHKFGDELFSSEAYVKRLVISKVLEHSASLQQVVPLCLWRIAVKTGIVYRYVHTMASYRKQDVETVFDCIKPSIALFVPTYSPVLERKVITLTNAIGRSSLEEEYERIVWRNLRARLRVYIRKLKELESWRLFMVHFFFTDQLGHLHRGNILKMLKDLRYC